MTLWHHLHCLTVYLNGSTLNQSHLLLCLICSSVLHSTSIYGTSFYFILSSFPASLSTTLKVTSLVTVEETTSLKVRFWIYFTPVFSITLVPLRTKVDFFISLQIYDYFLSVTFLSSSSRSSYFINSRSMVYSTFNYPFILRLVYLTDRNLSSSLSYFWI